ncbi:MAG: CoA-binding protein [Hamadaea sp.]|uniref:acetate--CoA ligase family protein n=1 Tax=Hamadaea sp. TaxID=2024425 RepID=UPI00180B04BD|nr:acetate--CoA ligase family protein [Hamadaea sp.]NUR73111.1 CoA-binding protein [Hamadaea sp.]NUT23023.1 CoA-binding protein [Hamadaea sp.]
MNPLFEPDSIAVFGASDKPGSWGRQLAEGALRSGVDVQLINLRPGQLKTIAFTAAPERPVDLAVIAVPAPAFPAAVDTALAAGARSVVGITAGLAPSVALQIAQVVRDQGAVLLGPNCLGVYDSLSGLSLLWGELPAGDVALFSQSGNLALELGAIARRTGLGFRRFASLGDAAGLRAVDLLPQHGDARAIALYLEDLSDGRALVEQAAAIVDSGIPVTLLAAGRSAVGAAAARTHTGALAGDHAVLAAACRDAGIRLVRTPTELIEACRVVPRVRGRRLGIVGDGGGHGILAADLAIAAGLSVPRPPVDLAGAGERDLSAYAEAVRNLAATGDVDCVLLTGYFGGYSADDPAMAAAELEVASVIGASGGDVPVVAHSFAGFPPTGPSASVRRLTAAGVPVWPAVEHAIEAVAHATTPRQGMPELPSTVDEAPSGDWYFAGRALLPEVAFAAAERVRDADEAVAAAERIGYPVVLKVLGRAHKSDDGGVVLGLRTAAEVTAAFGRVPASPAYAVEREHDLAEGIEVLVGARRDPGFGPVVVVGAGGLLTEVLGDSVVALAPVDAYRAEEMLRDLRIFPLLAGHRGRPAVDVTALTRVIVAVSEAVCRTAGLAALELNPVLVTPDGAVALDCHGENVS